jgi:uncharacterized protein (TIGR02594 family)
MIPDRYQDFYGDETRWFVGTVVDINDPLQVGRAKVRIDGIHGEDPVLVPNSGLPWAQTIIPVTEGGAAGYGNVTGLQPTARVFGIFLDGKNSQLPLILGSMPRLDSATPGGRSLSQLARGTNTIPRVRNETIGAPESAYAAQYPYNHVTATPGGHVIEMDDTPDAERVHIYHKSGTYIEIFPNGDMVTEHANGYRTVFGSENVQVSGDMQLIVGGKLEIWAGGNIDFKSSGNMTIRAPRIDLNPPGSDFGQPNPVLRSPPVDFPLNIAPALTPQQVPQGHPQNAENFDNGYVAQPLANCGEVPHRNPYDVAEEALNLGEAAWRETGSNPYITALWEEIGYVTNASALADETAWCAVFVGAILKRSGNMYIQTSGSQNYSNYGTPVELEDLQKGDIVVFYRNGSESGFGHVGFATGNYDDERIEILGGNQSNTLNISRYRFEDRSKGWGLRTIRRAISCEDGSTPPPPAGTPVQPSSGVREGDQVT